MCNCAYRKYFKALIRELEARKSIAMSGTMDEELIGYVDGLKDALLDARANLDNAECYGEDLSLEESLELEDE